MTQLAEAAILDYVRSPIGRRGGVFRELNPTDMLAKVLQGLMGRQELTTSRVDDVIAGLVLKHGEQFGNLARNAWLGAGFPETVPGTTIDRQCGSGQQAIQFASQAIRSHDSDFIVACGAESMSRVPLGWLFDPSDEDPTWFGSMLEQRYEGPIPPQGQSIEEVVERHEFTREELDEFSLRSNLLASNAVEQGYFTDHIVEMPGVDRNNDKISVLHDEGPRVNASLEVMSELRPVFAQDGVLTAGNSSQMSDGAAAMLLGNADKARAEGLQPRAKVVSSVAIGDDARLQFTAVGPALRLALKRAGLSPSDIDLYEVNEAFSPVPLLIAREFGVDFERLNVNGGSIAFGHPLGSTGTRLVGEVLAELERRDQEYGAVVICEGGGMANATIIQRYR